MRPGRKTLLAATATAAASLLAVGPATAAAAPRQADGLLRLAHGGTLNMTQSNNWSGYNQGMIEKGTSFSAITGTWVVPTATQHKSGQSEASSTWVGIGGGCLETSCTATDQTLIQAGTEQDVAANGKASYSAWYELIPVPSTTVPLRVSPGNRIQVAIKQNSPGNWSIRIRNLSTGRSWSTTTPYPSTMGSAEWIEETPLTFGTDGAGLSALPKLSRVHFTGATVNGAAAHLVGAERMQLVDSNGHILATPSLPNSARTAFNDCSYATFCPAP